jgi:hypothetical protein
MCCVADLTSSTNQDNAGAHEGSRNTMKKWLANDSL